MVTTNRNANTSRRCRAAAGRKRPGSFIADIEAWGEIGAFPAGRTGIDPRNVAQTLEVQKDAFGGQAQIIKEMMDSAFGLLLAIVAAPNQPSPVERGKEQLTAH
jgi:hypothetical protein